MNRGGEILENPFPVRSGGVPECVLEALWKEELFCCPVLFPEGSPKSPPRSPCGLFQMEEEHPIKVKRKPDAMKWRKALFIFFNLFLYL